MEKPFPVKMAMFIAEAQSRLKPEMKFQAAIADTVVKATEDDYDVVIVNFANADMVGHSARSDPQ